MVPTSSSTVSRRTWICVADLGRDDLVGAFVAPLVELDDAFGLVADVDHDVVADDVEDPAGDDLVGLEVLFFVGEPGGDVLVERFVELRLEFSVGQVELTEQIAVDHRVVVCGG